MIKFFSITFLLLFLSGCNDEKSELNGESTMKKSKEEKIRIISEKGYSEDLNQAPIVAEYLADTDMEVAGQACFYLGYLGARSYISDIERMIDDADENILNHCLSGLALMVDERDQYLYDQVLPFIVHESLLVRMSAVETISNIRSTKAVGSLIARFDNEDPAVQYEIVKALGKIGDAEALPLLHSYQQTVSEMDHSVPRKGSTRGGAPHPDVLELAIAEAIKAIGN
ncbi:HEAT repeat domain-containing protein [Teredinibacter turnerae]|uniref:HEAT repeat domain-containing protein n=1 Tax=Teredinibacter turnerae TaxID=2426 RepID=UPI0030D3F0CA